MCNKTFLALLFALLIGLAPLAPLAHAGGEIPPKRELRDVIGVCHINGFYNFSSNQDFLNEGADKILGLGSRVIKLVIRDQLQGYYPFNMKWPEITSLVQAAQTPYFEEVFSKPFTTYVLMTFAPGRDIHYFINGMTAEDIKHEQDAFYEFTKYLLTKYRGTGKTFILQNWEGDWVLTPPTDLNKEPEAKAAKGMIDWLNARQDGVERARREVGMDGVVVAHAAEVNRVAKALAGKGSVTNSVLPFTHCDLYSYSTYDTIGEGPEKFRQALKYLKDRAPDSKLYGADNVYLGEFGWPESYGGPRKRLRILKGAMGVALECKARYVLFWELYDDGPIRKYELRPQNADMVGHWLIRPDGTHAPLVWDYFAGMLGADH